MVSLSSLNIIAVAPQIKCSFTKPCPLGLVNIIISPLSATYNLHRAACLYTSYLFVYSVCDREMLHFMVPLCLRMPSYSYLLDDFDGHYRTRRCSPGGALTPLQPVVRAKSFPRCASRAVFQSSLSPLYLLD